MADHIIRTISDFHDSVCCEPMHTDVFTVYSSKKEDEVFRGTLDELLNSEYADIELASWDLAPQEGVLMCFNLDDEDYEYEDEEEDNDE